MVIVSQNCSIDRHLSIHKYDVFVYRSVLGVQGHVWALQTQRLINLDYMLYRMLGCIRCYRKLCTVILVKFTWSVQVMVYSQLLHVFRAIFLLLLFWKVSSSRHNSSPPIYLNRIILWFLWKLIQVGLSLLFRGAWAFRVNNCEL